MEQGDATATIGLQDALELLPQELHHKMLPANRTFLLRRTSKTMCAAVENAKLDTVVVRSSGVKFPNGAGLQDKFNGLNAWCKVTVLDLNECGLREGGAQAIAAVLRMKTTLTNLNLKDNWLGEGGGQAIAAALRENRTLTNLNLGSNSLREGGAQAIAAALRVNTTLTNLNLGANSLGEGGGQAIADVLRVNTTLTELDLRGN
jgi:Ran GTPase-activating protein (RanGAP) involved in mRNA processing and transport